MQYPCDRQKDGHTYLHTDNIERINSIAPLRFHHDDVGGWIQIYPLCMHPSYIYMCVCAEAIHIYIYIYIYIYIHRNITGKPVLK